MNLRADEPVTSRANPRIKAASALLHRKHREAERRYLIEGPHPVSEALAGGSVEEVFATPAVADDYLGRGVAVTPVADHVLDKLVTSRAPQGVVAVARQDRAALDDVLGHGFVVVCHAVADPGNAGAIIRTADAFGASGVVLTAGSVDPWNPKCVRAATGSLTHVPVVVEVALDEVMAACRSAGQQTVALATGGTAALDAPGLLSPPLALVFGSEAHGLPAVAVDEVATIVQYGRAESLNLAAAVAVASSVAARHIHGIPGRERRIG